MMQRGGEVLGFCIRVSTVAESCMGAVATATEFSEDDARREGGFGILDDARGGWVAGFCMMIGGGGWGLWMGGGCQTRDIFHDARGGYAYTHAFPGHSAHHTFSLSYIYIYVYIYI